MEEKITSINFSGIAKRIIAKTKAGETRVLFRLFPIRGVAFDQANLGFFKEVLTSASEGIESPIFLGCLTLEDFSITYPMHDVSFHEGITQENVNMCSRKIAGNFLLVACPYLQDEHEAATKIDAVAAVLRLRFGNFIVWPRFYEFMINMAAQYPKITGPQDYGSIYRASGALPGTGYRC